MKKLFALAALVLGLASCQTEPEGFGVVTGGEVDTVVTVSLPAATRSSEHSGLENVDATQFDLRYILEVYDVNSNNMRVLREVKPYEVTETTVTFPVRLIAGRDYKFVVWADFVANGSNDDNHYYTQGGLYNVTVIDNAWTANTEARDAYTSFVVVENYSGTQSINLELTRPFGKLRVVTTDIDALRYINALPTAVEFQYAAEVYTSFNALTGEAGTKATKSFDSYAVSNVDGDNVYGVYGEDLKNSNQQTLFADYLFVGAEQTLTTKFHMQVSHAYGAKKTAYSFVNDAPIVRNQLTTIIGSILTDANDVEVVVNDEFEAETFYLEGDVTLTADMEVNRPVVVKAGTKAVLNLNGHDIINTTDSETFGEGEGIIVYGELDIVGEGTVKGSTMAVWARGNGGNAVVNIYGGTFEGCAEGFAKGGRSVVYASTDNTINIYGGSVKALAADKTSYANKTEGVYAAINIQDNKGFINVYGGSFYKQNPAAPGTEPAAWNATHPNGFLGKDCYVEADGDWFEVIYDPYYGYTKVADIDELKEAIKTANNKIVFLNDITGDVTISNSVNINGDGKTYTGKMTLKADVTIKNVNFDGKGYNGYAIETRGANYVTIEDCTAKNYGYGFVQLASGTVLTTVKDVTVSNMNYGVKVDYSNAVVIENSDITAGVAAVLNSNYGEKSITIKNSYLNILGTWTRNNTTKTNYVFEGNNSIDSFIIDAAIDNFKLAAGATLTAPNEINVTTDAGYTVEYADGKYISKL
ncbi:MAG: right-handed parallel beta-helix repeat-containing protein [Alistipes sp.]|nr:right-handed parallel beta-helix repeat-containing protein [Alistipes sp.]